MEPPSIKVYIPRSERIHLIKQLIEKGPFYIIFWFVFDHDWGFGRENWEPVAVKYHSGQPSAVVLRPHCSWKIIDMQDIGSAEVLHVLFRGRGHAPVVKTLDDVDFDIEVEEYDGPFEPKFEEVNVSEVPSQAVDPRIWCLPRTFGQRLDIRLKLKELYEIQIIEGTR